MAGFAAYDESIPETSMHPYWVAHDDLSSLSRSSDIAFVGRITDYTEAVLVVNDDPTEEPDPTATVYDGVVFTVDELLVGELPVGETQVTIATRVLLRNTDGTPRFRVSATPIEIVRPGIFARNETDRQRYIVYALAGHKGTPFYANGIYFFNTPGGVAPVLVNDRIGIGAARPLADSGLGLDDVRTAARTATLTGASVKSMSRRHIVLVNNRDAIRQAAVRRKASSISLVGSVARGDDTDDSDYDFLACFTEGASLFDLAGLQEDLRDLLGRDVDVISAGGLRDKHHSILQDAITL